MKYLAVMLVLALTMLGSTVCAQDELSITAPQNVLVLSNDTYPTIIQVSTYGHIDVEAATGGGACSGYSRSNALVRFSWINDGRIPTIRYQGENETKVKLVLWDPNMAAFWCSNESSIDIDSEYPISGADMYYLWIAAEEPDQEVEGTLSFHYPTISTAEHQQAYVLEEKADSTIMLMLEVGGDLDIAMLDDRCKGYFDAYPALRIDWQGGNFPEFAREDGVGILLWDGSLGEWHCANAGKSLFLPDSMDSGTYYIWFTSREVISPEPMSVWITEAAEVEDEDAD